MKLFKWVLSCFATVAFFALPVTTWAATTYSTDHTVTGSETAYTSSAGNANVTWQNFNFRAAVDKDHLAHGYYFYLKDGDTDIGETDAAVKLDSITLKWGGDTGGGIGADDTPYLVVTTADDSPVIIGVSAAGGAFAVNGTSTFAFSDVVLASNAKYRFYFYKNDVTGLSVGATLTGATTGRVNGRYHNTSGDARADYNDIRCNGGAGYSINCSFVVSPLVAGDATVLETSSTAVSVGSVATPVVIEGKVADGIVEVGSAATVSGVFTVCGEATTLELTDSLTATAFYFPATVTIDASALSDLDPTGEDASKTTTLLSGALKYTTTPTVVLPAATAGMIYETNITSSGISVTVVKGVDCVETITADTSWSTIKPSGWVDSLVGDKPAITITYAGEDPVTLTFDETVQAGSLTLTGNIVVEASAAATFGTVNAGAGSVVEMANVTITTQSGSGVYRYRSGYPSTVPNQGLTYEYVGTADPENPGTVNLNGMRGTVKTTGYMSITGYYPLNTAARLDVVSGTTTLTAGGQAICGYITIREGATLVNTATDSLAYSSYNSIIDIYGTLDMGTSRWTVWSGAAFNLRGGEITGVGESNNGAIDLMGTCNVTAYADSTISANVKFRNALSNITVSDGVTLTISGETKPGYDGGGITKKGAGTLKFTSDPYVPGGITVEAGTLAFDTQGDVDPVVTYTAAVLNSANMDYAVSNNWKGTVVVSALEAGATTTQVALNKTGNANSYLTLNGISGDAWCAGSNYTVQPAITLAGDVNFQNGSSKKAVTFRKIAAGTGNLSLKSWSSCTGITYGFTTLDADNYTGTIQLDGSVLTFNVGDILKANAQPSTETPILSLTVTNNATVNLANATVNGKAAGFELKEDGVYYTTAYVTVTVPAVVNATATVTVGDEPIEPTTAGGNAYSVEEGATVTVTYSANEGYELSGTTTYTIANAAEGSTITITDTQAAAYVAALYAASTTNYTTLQAAVTAAADARNSKIVLLGSTASESATIPAVDSAKFYVVTNVYECGTISYPAGDYIAVTTSETVDIAGVGEGLAATVYSVTKAAVAVTVSGERSLYMAMYIGDAVNAAIAGGLGSTIEFVNGTDSTPYVSTLEASGFTLANNVWTFTTLPVAKVTHGVTETSYVTLAAAFANAQAGDTIKVLADNTLTGEIAVSKNLTLDLNGFTVTGAAGDSPMFNLGEVSFTITDTSEGKAGKAVSAGSKVILSGSACTITLTAGTLESGDVPVYLYENLNSVLNINGGKIVCSKTSGYAVSILNGTVNMTAGEVNSTCSGFCMHNATVNGGTIKIGSGSSWEVFYDHDNWTTTTITGGTFNRDVSQYVSSGYEILNNGDGTYTVRKDNGWMYAAPGHWDYTGTWSEGAALGEDKVTISDGATYSNRTASAGQLVTLDMTLSFDDVNDDDDDFGDAKAAIRLGAGETEGTYVFQLYTYEGSVATWKNATGFTPTVETDYNVLFVLDLTNKTYTASIVSGSTTNALSVGGSTTIAFANQNNTTPVQQIDFVGSGTVSSIEGSYEDAPAPEGFVENDEVTLSDGTATLTAAQATWLNACGAKAAVAAKIATMDSTAFNNAYLLNLDITGEFSYEFKVSNINVAGENVTLTVSLTRMGALANKINGTVALTGTDELGKTFATISEAVVTDDDFSDNGSTTTITLKTGGAKFFQPTIE